MTKMYRESLVAYGQPLCETVVDCPAPRGSEVLVRVERCGVCHSDLHLQDGYFLLGGDKRLDVTAGRTLPFTLGHEIAGVIEATGDEAGGRDRWPAVSRSIRGSAAARARHASAGEENLCAQSPSSRHHRRWRLCHPCARPASALSARLCAAVAGVCRAADVLRFDGLFGAQAAHRSPRARAGPARWARRGGHDGPCDRPRAVSHAADRRRHRCGKAQGRARSRRGPSLRPVRSASAQGSHDGNRRAACSLRFRRLR